MGIWEMTCPRLLMILYFEEGGGHVVCLESLLFWCLSIISMGSEFHVANSAADMEVPADIRCAFPILVW
jgi:hypothetical protein